MSDGRWRERIDAQQVLIDELRAVIDGQEARLARIERGATGTRGPVEAHDTAHDDAHDHAHDDQAHDDRRELAGARLTDRRHLLTRAATVAAGAVVGGAALALGQASPAEAASGTFDGTRPSPAPPIPRTASASRGTRSMASA